MKPAPGGLSTWSRPACARCAEVRARSVNVRPDENVQVPNAAKMAARNFSAPDGTSSGETLRDLLPMPSRCASSAAVFTGAFARTIIMAEWGCGDIDMPRWPRSEDAAVPHGVHVVRYLDQQPAGYSQVSQ
jgi:hypothetical protein